MHMKPGFFIVAIIARKPGIDDSMMS
jgi:hypothetical protein